MREVNLLDSYPRAKRPIADHRATNPQNRAIARQFGREYFDGDRSQGYGGYCYDGRWVVIARHMRDFYSLKAGDSVLDVGCAKGFLLHDFRLVLPDVKVAGLDISQHAIEYAMEDVRSYLVLGTARNLPFRDRSFDLVVSINTLHNLDRDDCVYAIREIERVSRRLKYIQVDSWLNEEQRQNLERWALTAITYFDPAGWRKLFAEAVYTGDYYWTLTE